MKSWRMRSNVCANVCTPSRRRTVRLTQSCRINSGNWSIDWPRSRCKSVGLPRPAAWTNPMRMTPRSWSGIVKVLFNTTACCRDHELFLNWFWQTQIRTPSSSTSPLRPRQWLCRRPVCPATVRSSANLCCDHCCGWKHNNNYYYRRLSESAGEPTWNNNSRAWESGAVPQWMEA